VALGWDEDNDPAVRAAVDHNLRHRVLPIVVASANARDQFSHKLACHWQSEILHGVAVAPAEVAGSIRDPRWCSWEVAVAGVFGTLTAQVGDQIRQFDQAFTARVKALDAAVDRGDAPASPEQVRAVLMLAADVHGEWIRIHPFVNGNGRTARLWANWALMRYGLRHCCPSDRAQSWERPSTMSAELQIRMTTQACYQWRRAITA
jgi:prophage maintenance system killer protein